MAHTTDIQVGDKFRFRGLTGQDADDRTITILGCSVSGSISFRIDMDGEEEPRIASGLHSIEFSAAVVMVEQGIWKEIRVEREPEFGVPPGHGMSTMPWGSR